MKNFNSCFLVLDFGSQYSWLITRCLRELSYYSRVESFDFSLEEIQKLKPAGIILSGGPASVLSPDSPVRDVKELLKIAPLMGICYGFQLICHQFGGQITVAHRRTYGSSQIKWKKNLSGDINVQQVWMSHGDVVSQIPSSFTVLAKTTTQVPAVLRAPNILATQFHPEVSHTKNGKHLFSYFAEQICGVKNKEWTVDSMLMTLESKIKQQLKPTDHVLCALSGGVDSTVMACLLTQILGPANIHCVFVDTGLLRKNEFQDVLTSYKKLNLNVTGISAENQFLSALKGVEDPERKRKIIGGLFIQIFEEYKKKNPEIEYLAQGTLYPDVIESLSVKGPSDIIKTHHNVGGLPNNISFKLVEPFRFLFKDEVRILGKNLKIPSEFLDRHPFPGPGLAIRMDSQVTAERLHKLREADAIFIEEIKKADLYHQIWQAFAVLLSVRTVGVQGDKRTYDEAIALRAVMSTDGMTADWFMFSPKFLYKVSNRITNEVIGINKVVYDITSKPPSTIEWL